jgi:hypothetical protein
MMKISLTVLILICAAEMFAQTQTKCFRNDGLRDNHIVRFEAEGGDVIGSYFVESDGSAEQPTQTFNFSGTRSGNALTVRFAADMPPGVAPSKTKSLIWTLAQSADGEILRIKFYGKNYETNKYADYSADFVPCGPNFATLAKQAKRISFAKGAKSAAFALSFKLKSERKAFWLSARKGQTVSVMSPRCEIWVYYLDKTADKEGGIDTFTMENIPQTGDYLFVISPASEPGDCATTFEITN